MSEKQVAEIDPEYEIIVAVEEDRLRDMIETTLKEAGRPYLVVAPDLLPEREYPGDHWIILGSDNIEKIKSVAGVIVKKWGRKAYNGCENFDFIYLTKSELKDEDVLSLWAIAGWDSTSIWGYQASEADYQKLHDYLKRMVSPDDL